MNQIVIDFTVPGKSHPNRPRFTRAGFVYLGKDAKNYREHVRARAIEAMHLHKPLEGAVMVDITDIRAVPASWSKKKREQAMLGVIRPTSRPDVDNIVKLVLDSCFLGVVCVDDAQVVELTVRKKYGDTPSLRVRVFEVMYQ